MDYTMRMVYETEGQHGADIRGWNGEQAREQADMDERRAYEEYMRKQEDSPHCNHLRVWETKSCDAICRDCGENLGFIMVWRDKMRGVKGADEISN